MRYFRALSLAVVATVLAACENEGPSNVPPTVAFAVQCAPLECTFTNNSSDADGSITGYQWDFGDSSAVETTRDAAHQYLESGQFTVTLTVTDDDAQTAVATALVDVNVPAAQPTAMFAHSCRYLTCEFIDQSFAGSPGASVAFHNWDFGDNSDREATRHPTHTYAAPGLYTVRLTVHDYYGTSASMTTLVDLSDPNHPPTAGFASSCTSDFTCTFTDQSTDQDGSVVSYRWDFGDGQVSDGRNPEHTFALEGTYLVKLTVTDNEGQTTSFTSQVAVPAPVFDFTVSCTGPECTFTSKTPQEWWITWWWDFGDGTTSTEWDPTHVYDVTRPTTFTVTLSVWGDALDGGSISHEITVEP
jgi:PKD repeat protein